MTTIHIQLTITHKTDYLAHLRAFFPLTVAHLRANIIA